jgi:D-psicose/D-tagatose/L-ribulose 3-epimerase
MVTIGAHTFAWSPSLTDGEATAIFQRLEGSAVDFVEAASYDLGGLSPHHLRNLSDRHGLPHTLCSGLPRGLSLASADAGQQQEAKDHVRRLLDFAQASGAFKISGPIHGDLSKPALEPSHPDDWQRLCDAYHALSEEIAAWGKPFSVEPLNRYQSSLINTLEQADILKKSVGRANFGILADLFHANMEQGHLYNDLEKHQPSTTHVHLCGANRGLIGSCHLDWQRLAQWLKDFPSAYAVSIETFNSQDPLLAQRTRTWRELGDSSEQIVLKGAATLKHLIGAASP